MTATALRDRFTASLSADRLAEKIEIAGRHIAIDGATLARYPGDENARLSAREAAREILWACDQLERLTR